MPVPGNFDGFVQLFLSTHAAVYRLFNTRRRLILRRTMALEQIDYNFSIREKAICKLETYLPSLLR